MILPTSSHTGKCRCACGSINEFRSDFTYHVGDWVGIGCRVCDRVVVLQRVVELTAGLSEEALAYIREHHL